MSARDDESPRDKAKRPSPTAETTPPPKTSGAKVPTSDAQETEGDFENPASVARATTARLSPQQLLAGRFKILRFIGQGGMGEVYEAEDLELREHVALKTIRPEIARDERTLERFKREIQLARKVTHPSVCRVFDVFRDRTSEGETIFLSMELLAGETLAERLKRSGRISTTEAFPLVCQMAAALEAAHDAGIVHRDFKTGNVMLVPAVRSQELEAKLPGTNAPVRAVVTDFGLARSAVGNKEAATTLSTGTGFVGTPAYMAPEQVEGGEVTAAADIYALGVVMYEMLTGRQPFIGETPLATAVKRLKESPPAPRALVPSLDPRWEQVIVRCLERHPADRFASAADVVKALTGETVEVGRRQLEQLEQQKKRQMAWGAAIGVLLVGLAASSYFYFHGTPRLTEKDTIVLADFTNTTGDPVFDGTLRQGLAVQLEQSPFLSLISDPRIQETLRLMGRPVDAKLTAQIAREICQRTGSAAVLDGSIASLGTQYVLGLKAVKCGTGDSLAEEQERANGKEQVLAAMDKAAAKMRSKLGESLNSIQKYDVPLARVTTASLEALKAFSQGVENQKKGSANAIPFFQHAIELDSNFAIAYNSLGIMYSNSGQIQLARQNISKAYELREQTSEREQFAIASAYCQYVTGDLEQAGRTYELWIQSYPRDFAAHNNLSFNSFLLGQYENTVTQARKAIELEPGFPILYSNLAGAYVFMNRPDDARAVIEEAHQHKLDDIIFHVILDGIAVAKGDMQGMTEQARWAAGKPGADAIFLASQADAEAYTGHLAAARQLSRQATEAAARYRLNDQAANSEGAAALREALYGNPLRARELALAALATSGSRDQQALAALALAVAGEAVRVEGVIKNLAKNFPTDTIANLYWLPTIRAQLALAKNRPMEANNLLQGTAAYDSLGFHSCMLYPAYVRADAYLRLHRGDAAASEFQKVLNHRGLVQNCPTGALAHLGLGRAYAIAGRNEKARTAYNDFLILWKDADPDIPILRQAKTEFAKLESASLSTQ